MATWVERVEGGMWGLLVGDAVGVPYEFHGPDELPPRGELEPDPPPGFRRSHPRVPPGTWSDDGAQALALLASLLEIGELDTTDLARRLVAWRRDGYLAVDGKVFDVGNQTEAAILRLEDGVPPDVAGPSDERANGNGSLMRVLPLALWHHGSDAELVADAERQSRVTHGHVRSMVCCALYCLWGRALLDGRLGPFAWAATTLRKVYAREPERLHELEAYVRPDEPPVGGGSGYVVDTLASARMVLDVGDYEGVVRGAIALGRDTDTTAAVAGGLAGVRDGVSAIPPRWLARLRGAELAAPLIGALVARGPRPARD